MHRLKIAALLIFPCLAFLCLSDTAQGQTITVSATSGGTAVSGLTFSVPAGTSQTNATYQQTVYVSTSNGSASLSFKPPTTITWLYLDGFDQPPIFVSQSGTTPVPLTVGVSTTGLTSGASTSSSFQVCFQNTNVNCVNVPVTLNVTNGTGGNGTLTSSPASLSFTALQGATSASSQNIQILNSVTSLSYNLSAVEQNGGAWITFPNGSAGTENSSTLVPVGVSSTILPTLGAGTYTGTITATDTNNNFVSISVTLTISTGALLTPSPLSFNFLYQINGTIPPAQTLSVSSNSGSQTFGISFSQGVGWLQPSGFGGDATPSAPATITFTPTPGTLAAGSYTTNIIISPFQGNPLPPIPVTLVISPNPLQLSSSSVTFTAPFGGASPASQNVQISTFSAGSVGFTASSDSPNWLSVSPNTGTASATQQPLTISANTSALSVGTYTGHILVKPSDQENYTETITVALTVTNSAQLVAAPSTLLFSYEATKTAPGPQQVSIQSLAQATTFTYNVTPNTCNGSTTWLTVSNASGSTTPATIEVSAATTGMNPGLCTGTIAVYSSGSNTPLNIPIAVVVADGVTKFTGTNSTAELTILQPSGFGYFNVQQTAAGVSPQSQTLYLGSTDVANGVPYTFSLNSAQNWLFTSQNESGTTPQSVTLSAFPAGLAAGTYFGTLTISSPNLPSALIPTGGTVPMFTIPLTLVVTPNVTITPSATSLGFNYTSAGSTPANQSLTLTASGGVASYTASVVNTNNCPSLLNLSPSSGTLNPTGTITVSIASTNSTAGTISCQIALTYLNASTQALNIPVTLTVAPAVTVTAAPLSLTYAYTIGSTQPAAQQLTVSSTGGSVQFSVGTTVTSGGNWLAVDTTTGTTGGTGTTLTKVVNVSVNTQGLAGSATGTAYTGTISITSPGVLATAITVAVTLTVTQPPNPQPTIVTNNASNVAGVIAPGELITIKGTLMGPTTPAQFGLNSQGGVNNTLGGVQVTFNNIPGTPIYVSASQINVTVPWEINGQTSANILVTYNGNTSAPINVSVNSVAPAIYTLNSTGSGQAAAINQNGTYNGPPGGSTIPAPAGSVVVLYATGCGVTSPPGITGSVSPTTQLLQVTAPVSAAFGPLSNPLYGKVTFIGAAPGLVTGVCQVNVQLPVPPAGVPFSGSQNVTLTVNGVSSTLGPTIAIQ